jgi:hypothetical protein
MAWHGISMCCGWRIWPSDTEGSWDCIKYEISNGSGVKVVNFATSKNQVVKSKIFLHQNIHKYTWTYTEGNTHNQIEHVLIDKMKHSDIVDVKSLGGTDYDTIIW